MLFNILQHSPTQYFFLGQLAPAGQSEIMDLSCPLVEHVIFLKIDNKGLSLAVIITARSLAYNKMTVKPCLSISFNFLEGKYNVSTFSDLFLFSLSYLRSFFMCCYFLWCKIICAIYAHKDNNASYYHAESEIFIQY